MCGIYCGTARETIIKCCVRGFTAGLGERLLFNVVLVNLLWDGERDYSIVLCGGFIVRL